MNEIRREGCTCCCGTGDNTCDRPDCPFHGDDTVTCCGKTWHYLEPNNREHQDLFVKIKTERGEFVTFTPTCPNCGKILFPMALA